MAPFTAVAPPIDLDALDKAPIARVDLDAIPDRHVLRHLGHEAGIHLGRLGRRRDRRALHDGVGLDDLQLHEHREVDADRLPLEVGHLDSHSVDQDS